MDRNSRVAKFAAFLVIIMLGPICEAGADGPCGTTPINTVFLTLSHCMKAARDPKAPVPRACCDAVKKVVQMGPCCLSAVSQSAEARLAGIVPSAAMSIPDRCNIRDRPAGRIEEDAPSPEGQMKPPCRAP